MVKFIETIKCNNKKILTPIGEVPILYIHKTTKLKKYCIKLENGLELVCAENHVIIDKDFIEVFSKDSLNKIIQTVKGNSKVVSVTDLNELDNFYDLELEDYPLLILVKILA